MQLFVAFIFLFGGVVGVFVFQHIEKFLLFPPSKAFQTNSSLLLKKNTPNSEFLLLTGFHFTRRHTDLCSSPPFSSFGPALKRQVRQKQLKRFLSPVRHLLYLLTVERRKGRKDFIVKHSFSAE